MCPLIGPASPCGGGFSGRTGVSSMKEMGLKLPPTRVDIADIGRRLHAAEAEAQKPEHRKGSGQSKPGRRHG